MPLKLFLLFNLASFSMGDDVPLVETKLGKVQGFPMESRSEKGFFGFQGIPFAKPPIGELRFQPPEPAEPWSGVLEAVNPTPFCSQVIPYDPAFPYMGEEDCLYLNIYTRNFSGNAPVLLHIVGGAFQAGYNDIYGPQFLMDEDIVIVAPNFRVGIFGFLSFEDNIIPGNQGMKDQVMALRWIQENVRSFGGDPNCVTIIGESSGGASVYHHIVSPMSRGLFHRAMAESGSSYDYWSIVPPGLASSNGHKVASLLGCTGTSKEQLSCLVSKTAEEIASTFKHFYKWQMDPLVNFGPVFEKKGENAFLVGPMSEWDHSPVPLITGVTSGEGLFRLSVILRRNTDFKWYSEHFEEIAPYSLLYYATSSDPQGITQKIRDFYFPNKEISLDDWANLTDMYSDSWFVVGATDAANNHKGDVYFYYFDYVFLGNFVLAIDPKYMIAAYHVFEATLIWDLTFPIFPLLETDEDIALSQKFVKFITDFMKHGVPMGQEWKKWTQSENNYMEISKSGFNMKKGLLEDRYKFWKTLKYNDKIPQ